MVQFDTSAEGKVPQLAVTEVVAKDRISPPGKDPETSSVALGIQVTLVNSTRENAVLEFHVERVELKNVNVSKTAIDKSSVPRSDRTESRPVEIAIYVKGLFLSAAPCCVMYYLNIAERAPVKVALNGTEGFKSKTIKVPVVDVLPFNHQLFVGVDRNVTNNARLYLVCMAANYRLTNRL